jgi:hypothetical protein
MPAQITLVADFDHGSLNTDQSFVSNDQVFLVGRDNFYPNKWKWLYFNVLNTQDRRLKFQISDAFVEGADRLASLKMVYSYDQQAWHFFDHGTLGTEGGTYHFHNDHPFDHPSVYIAYGIPYPLQRITDWINRIHTSPWVHPTSSANPDLTLGWSSGGTDELGRSIPPHTLYGFRITDLDVVTRKTQIVLMSGVHPNEPLANYLLEGLIDFLIGDTPEAQALRRVADVYVYPMVNPDGRFAGYNRSTVQHIDRDANRCWREELYADMDDIRYIAEAIKMDAGLQVDYFIDFHCWSGTEQHFGILSFEEGFHLDPFWKALIQREPTIGTEDSDFENWSTETFAVKRLNAGFSMTFENMFIPGENIDRYHRLGRNMGLAFADVLG